MKQEQEPMPICMEQSPLDLARAAVQAADERLSALRREFLELQER
jgi:hypothetical protein